MSGPPRLLASFPRRVAALASDGRRVVVGVEAEPTRVLDRVSGSVLGIVTGDWAYAIRLVGDLFYRVAGPTGCVSAFGLDDLAIRPGPSIADVEDVRPWSGGLVTGGRASPARVWNERHEVVRELGLKRPLNAFDADDEIFVAAYSGGASRAGPVRVFDLATGKRRRAGADGHAGPVLSVLLDATGIATGSSDGTVRLFDRETLDLVRVLELPGRGRARELAFESSHLVVAAGRAVHRFDRASGALVDTTPFDGIVGPLAVEPTGILVGVDGHVHVIPLGVSGDEHAPDVRAEYERDGCFDKDVPGWLTTRVEIEQEGWRVIIRTWFDAAGTTQDEVRSVGVVGKATGDVVPIQLDDGRLLEFNLATRRLV